MVLGNLPSYSHLKVFGCLYFTYNLLPQKHKFDAHSKLGIFLGYLFGQKGYKTYDLATRTICTSSDVLFYKHLFLFHDFCIQPFTHPVMPLPIFEFPNDKDVFPHVEHFSSFSPTNNVTMSNFI